MLITKKVSKQRKEELWEAYRENPDDKENYNSLVEAYLPLVEIIATKMKGNLPQSVELGDLINDGYFGLVDAIVKFDASKGYKFETYASNRIRGQINDSLRQFDWVSRYSRLKFKYVSQTQNNLSEELQREPSSQDIADRLGWDLSEVLKVQASYLNSFSVNIDDYLTEDNHEFFSLSEVLADTKLSDVEYGLEFGDLTTAMEEALFSLSEQQSVVVYLHHYEQLQFAEIAKLLKVEQSRVSLLYSQALERMRDCFALV